MKPAFVGLAAAALAGGLAHLGHAQSVESFYKERQIRFVIATAAGGDYDLWGRTIVRHMGDHIPGHPTFVPTNMPGGGGIVAANFLYNVAPKDGSTFGIIGRNLANDAVMQMPTVKYDPAKFNWLGSPELPHRVCTAMNTAPVKTAKDLFKT